MMESVDSGPEIHSTGSESIDHIIAHDLTNHLAIIQGTTDLLLADCEDIDMTDRLTTIKRQTTAALTLLQTVAAVTRGGGQAEFTATEVNSVLSIEINRLQSAYPEAKISADVDDSVRVQADDLLSSVFANLLENAIKHNDAPAPSVLVTVSSDGDTAIITVEDDGPGLPETVRNRRLCGDFAHPESGVHIIHSLVARYGGNISVDTGREGTKVTIELPAVLE